MQGAGLRKDKFLSSKGSGSQGADTGHRTGSEMPSGTSVCLGQACLRDATTWAVSFSPCICFSDPPAPTDWVASERRVIVSQSWRLESEIQMWAGPASPDASLLGHFPRVLTRPTLFL